MFGNCFDRLCEVWALSLPPWCDGTIPHFQGFIRHHQSLIKKPLLPQPVTLRACTEGRVEREQTRFNFRNCETAHRTREIFAEGNPLRITLIRGSFQNCNTIGEVKRGSKTIGKAGFYARTHHNPINHNVDIMAKFLIQGGRIIQLIKSAIHFHALKPLLSQFKEFFAIFTLSIAHDRG